MTAAFSRSDSQRGGGGGKGGSGREGGGTVREKEGEREGRRGQRLRERQKVGKNWRGYSVAIFYWWFEVPSC